MLSKIKIYYCKFPLRIDYKLSYGIINTFDTILIEIEDNKDRLSYGEATFLPGYSNEKPGECVPKSVIIANKILKLDIADALKYIKQYKNMFPFLTSAFVTSIENIFEKYSNKYIKVPIIGLINEENAGSIRENIENFIAMGYKVIKTKIGINSMKKDLKKIKLIDKYADGKLKIRVDANQSLEHKNINDIIKDFSPFNLQLLEQPFKKDNLEKHLELNKKAPFPIMLDESIWDFHDVDLVYEKSISNYIKLKLQKCGGLSQFESMINYAKQRNINIIIGNGVQTDLNCMLEGQIYNKCRLTEAAENIGFSKLMMPITKNKIIIKNGHILIADEPIELDTKTVDNYIISKKVIGG